MKIAVFTDSCLPYCSGVTYAALAQMRELCKRGHEVIVFRPKPGKRYRRQTIELPPNASMRDIPFTLPAPRLPELRLVVPTVLTTWRYLSKDVPDVVHVHTEWGCGWEGLFSAKRLKVPVVGTFHTFFAEPGYLKSLRLPTWNWIQRVVWRYAVSFFNRCDAITSPSEAVKNSLMAHGVNKEPMVISNGSAKPPLLDQEQIQRMRAKHHISGPSFVYVGRIAPEKSLDILVQGFAGFLKKCPSAKLILIGDGPSRSEVNSQIEGLGIEDSVIQLGFVPHANLIDQNLLRMGDAFVTASKTENQPLSVLEAMSFGLPIIGPRAKGLCEMIDDGVNGFAFMPDDVAGLTEAFEKLANCRPDSSDYAELSAAAESFTERHSLDASIDQLEDLYSKLTGLPVSDATAKADRHSLSAA